VVADVEIRRSVAFAARCCHYYAFTLVTPLLLYFAFFMFACHAVDYHDDTLRHTRATRHARLLPRQRASAYYLLLRCALRRVAEECLRVRRALCYAVTRVRQEIYDIADDQHFR